MFATTKYNHGPILWIGLIAVLLCAQRTWADTWITANVFAVQEGTSSNVSTFTPLTHHDTGHGTYQGIYLRTGVTKFKFAGGELAQSYTTVGESLAVGLGINRKFDSTSSFLAGADVEFRNQNATHSQSTSGKHLTIRVGATLYQEWTSNDKLSITLSYAPRFDSYWFAVMNAHTISAEGWYIGPQVSAAGEQEYSSKSIAMVVGKPSMRKGDFGFTASFGVSKAATSGSKVAPFFSASISY